MFYRTVNEDYKYTIQKNRFDVGHFFVITEDFLRYLLTYVALHQIPGQGLLKKISP
jgi:hypothetical protein